tara:strand:- start:2118 stop:2321 length:204 start_codon:yes stop_codon:yes gene_type:complete
MLKLKTMFYRYNKGKIKYEDCSNEILNYVLLGIIFLVASIIGAYSIGKNNIQPKKDIILQELNEPIR